MPITPKGGGDPIWREGDVPKPERVAKVRRILVQAESAGGDVLLRLGDLLPRIDEEWHRRKLKSRSETIRVLLAEALK